MIINNAQLNETQLHDLKQLAELCHCFDKGTPAIYYRLLQNKRDANSNLLYYQDNNLIGFLSVYFFYENACEISLLVAPAFRQQGIATSLLRRIIPLMELKKMLTVIFSAASSFEQDWFLQKNLYYSQSEHHMLRDSYEPIFIPKPCLQIRKAQEEQIKPLCAIDAACFFSNPLTMTERFNQLLNDHRYTLLIAVYENEIIGKAHIFWQESDALISDIAILPLYQKKGLGGELLAASINAVLQEGLHKIKLEVEANNKHALNLYLKKGFKIMSTVDFWMILTQKLLLTVHSKGIGKMNS